MSSLVSAFKPSLHLHQSQHLGDAKSMVQSKPFARRCDNNLRLTADDVKQGLDAHFVDQYSQSFDLALLYDPAEEPPSPQPALETALTS